MSIMTFVLCIVLIETSSASGSSSDPAVLVTGVIALFGVLITGLFVFMTFRIDRGARYEAQAVAQKAITQAREEARKAAKEEARKTAEEEARKVARDEVKNIAEKEAGKVAKEEVKNIAKEEVKNIAEEQFKLLLDLIRGIK